MKTSLQILQEARAKIAKPENWTKGTFAVDASGKSAWVKSNDACAWCSAGALNAVTGNYNSDFDAYYGAARALNAAAGKVANYVIFNDDPATRHEDVLAMFDRAIAAEEQQEAQVA